jgi:hypothetical protein
VAEASSGRTCQSSNTWLLSLLSSILRFNGYIGGVADIRLEHYTASCDHTRLLEEMLQK